jgi:hypothetical protein
MKKIVSFFGLMILLNVSQAFTGGGTYSKDKDKNKKGSSVTLRTQNYVPSKKLLSLRPTINKQSFLNTNTSNTQTSLTPVLNKYVPKKSSLAIKPYVPKINTNDKLTLQNIRKLIKR